MLDLSFLMGPQGFIMEEANNRKLVANKTHMQEMSGLFQGRLILEYPCMGFFVVVFFAFYKKSSLSQHIFEIKAPPLLLLWFATEDNESFLYRPFQMCFHPTRQHREVI